MVVSKSNQSRVTCILVLTVWLFFTACPSTTPEQRIKELFECVLSNNLDKAHAYFVYIDRVTIGKGEFIATYSGSAEQTDFIASHQEAIAYVHQHLAYVGDTAHATINVRAPEFMAPLLNMILYHVDTVITHDSTIVFRDSAFALYRLSGEIRLIKEDRNWYVLGNWVEQRRIEATLAQERVNYIQKFLSVSNLRVYETSAGQMGLKATLHNNGNKVLKEVEVYVVCYTKENNPCFTITKDLLAAQSLAPKSSRGFSVDLSQAPMDWSRRVDVKILNCWF